MATNKTKPKKQSAKHSLIRRFFEYVLILLILAILPLAVIYMHYSAYRTWTDATYLEQNGIAVDGTVTETYESSGPRSGPNYYITFHYEIRDFIYVKRQQVDQATYILHTEGDEVTVRYDPEDPYRADIQGNDYRSISTFILVVLDLLLFGAAVYIWRSTHKKPVLPPNED